jgi:hypothetical protein
VPSIAKCCCAVAKHSTAIFFGSCEVSVDVILIPADALCIGSRPPTIGCDTPRVDHRVTQVATNPIGTTLPLAWWRAIRGPDVYICLVELL